MHMKIPLFDVDWTLIEGGNVTAQELGAVGADAVLDSLQEEDAFFDFIEQPAHYR